MKKNNGIYEVNKKLLEKRASLKLILKFCVSIYFPVFAPFSLDEY